MGDGRDRQHDQPQNNSGIDFNSIINGGTRAHGPEAAQRPQDVQRPGQQPTDVVKIGTDATNTVTIANHTLELSFKDQYFDNKLVYASLNGADKFEKIKIDDLPPNYVVHTWIDKNGYYFWYDDGTKTPKAHHYLPNNAFGLEANNARIDLDSERKKDNDAFAQAYLGGFKNFDRNFVPSKDGGGTNAASYYWGLAGGSQAALDIQEHALRESVRASDDPYFKIYLSDILAAQALKPIRDRADQHLPVTVNNEYTRKKLDDSLSVGQAAYDQTKGELGKFNQFPSLNVYLPLAPQRPFWDHNRMPDDWMGYWGGGYNQSYGRTQNLTAIRGEVISGFLPKINR